MSRIEIHFTILLIISLIGLFLVIRYDRKMRKLRKK